MGSTTITDTGEPDDHESLPHLYGKWVTDLLGGSIPRERRATCDACAMCAEPQFPPETRSYYFDPNVKCCTYVPELPNFLVGRILGDAEIEPGRGSVEQRIAARDGVTPLGLMQPSVFSLIYRNAFQAFGRSKALRCPHLTPDGGRCGIWRNRNSVCTTWFCKHVRGATGSNFWRALHRLLGILETELAHWCALELRLDCEPLSESMVAAGKDREVTGDALDNVVRPETYARLWGSWRGREHEFFRRCAELVTPLSWTNVLDVCGPSLRAHALLTRQAYDRLVSRELPPVLVAGSMYLARMNRHAARISTYSDYDPLDVPSSVMELLSYFDGRPTEEVLATIAEQRGVHFERGLLQKMVDFKLLVPPDSAEALTRK